MSAGITLSPAALTSENFSAFGDVIQTQGARHFEMNGGTLERYYDLADINIGADSGGRPVISIAKCRQLTVLPLEIAFLERHPLGSQAIYPLFNQTMIVVVAPPEIQFQRTPSGLFIAMANKALISHPVSGIYQLLRCRPDRIS